MSNEDNNPEEVFIVHSTSECTDPRAGANLVGFLEDGLSDEDRERFAEHLHTCPACLADISNAATINYISKRHVLTGSGG